MYTPAIRAHPSDYNVYPINI
ncbi:hypothetical protein MTBSS4_250002 [Magnetospirillum sp. SS-4]|nr:hypothetical protein MTBSS4_250002 [Magnetospirillum sp. SS-4]